MKTEIDAVCAANQGFYRGIQTCKKRGRSALVGRFVRMGGLEPPLREELDPKSNAATNYATSANVLFGFKTSILQMVIKAESGCKGTCFLGTGKIYLHFSLSKSQNRWSCSRGRMGLGTDYQVMNLFLCDTIKNIFFCYPKCRCRIVVGF